MAARGAARGGGCGSARASVRARHAPDGIAYVVRHQQRALSVQRHAHGAPQGLAVLAQEASEKFHRRPGRPPVGKRQAALPRRKAGKPFSREN